MRNAAIANFNLTERLRVLERTGPQEPAAFSTVLYDPESAPPHDLVKHTARVLAETGWAQQYGLSLTDTLNLPYAQWRALMRQPPPNTQTPLAETLTQLTLTLQHVHAVLAGLAQASSP